MASENETFDEVLRCMQNDIVHFVGKPVKHSRDLLQEYHDRFKAAHHREVSELKSKMNDVVCENEALRDACGTCGAKREREATRDKSSQFGNAAKLREALSETKSVIEKCLNILRYIPDGCEYDEILDEVANNLWDLQKTHVKPSLSAPPRNCDLYRTKKELDAAYEKYREYVIMSNSNPFVAKDEMITKEDWLFAEAKGETKA